MPAPLPHRIHIVNTRPEHFDGIIQLSREVYPGSRPWREEQLASHLEQFPEGQWVAVDHWHHDQVVGMAASLIIQWDDYEGDLDWKEFTEGGTFANHDPEEGRTLYGAEIMVRPGRQGQGIGKRLYASRRELATRLDLLRIRAGARLRGYGKFASVMSPVEYVQKVIRRQIGDPTLSFQLKQGFRVVRVVEDYLPSDRESGGWAAVIEWFNPRVATPEDLERADPRFRQGWGTTAQRS